MGHHILAPFSPFDLMVMLNSRPLNVFRSHSSVSYCFWHVAHAHIKILSEYIPPARATWLVFRGCGHWKVGRGRVSNSAVRWQPDMLRNTSKYELTLSYYAVDEQCSQKKISKLPQFEWRSTHVCVIILPRLMEEEILKLRTIQTITPNSEIACLCLSVSHFQWQT